jgi:hypothetical protein
MGFFSLYSGDDKKAVNVEFVLKMLSKLIPPIGFIYMSASSDNPSTIYPDTIWTRWGEGRVPVGVDASHTEFNSGEKTGGEKAHTLTIAEMPSHTHVQEPHNHAFSAYSGLDGTDGHAGRYGWIFGNSVNVDSTTAVNKNAGGDHEHNNLQPHITCYMFKRIR